MSFKGTASKSASGASMSKYDVEVEARLQALEKAVAECKATCAANAAKSSGGGGSVTGLAAGVKEVAASGDGAEAKVDALLNLLADQ
jgi:hypothetical protein